jgi:hypothetical protein
MWGVRNKRLFSHKPTLRCPKCGQFTGNAKMASNCLSMSGFRPDRHNTALQLLLSLVERHNGGRWETITADFGDVLIKSFTATTLIHNPLDYHPLTPPTCQPV